MVELNLLTTDCVGTNCFINSFAKGYIIGVASLCILLVIIELLYILNELHTKNNTKKNT